MRVTKKLAAAMITLATVIAVAGTSIPVEAAAKAPKKITLKTTSKTVDIKGKATISVKSVSPKGADKGVKYQSSNKKVATVSSKGVVTGKKAGKTTITVTSKKNKKVKKKITIAVKQLKPTSISLPAAVSLKVGAKQALKATVKPAGVYCPVAWSSSDASVAAVDSKGNVQAKKAGTAVITVKAKEKNKSGKYISKSCTVTVAGDVTEPEYKYVNCTELLTNKDQYIVLDIRPNDLPNDTVGYGYKYGHIEGSVWVPAWPVNTKELEDMLKTKSLLQRLNSSDKKIAIVCRSGQGGAKNTIKVLIGQGIPASRLLILEGGGTALIQNHKNELVTGSEDTGFLGKYVISAAEAKAKIDAGAIAVDADYSTGETVKDAISLKWKEISQSDQQDGANKKNAGDQGFARSLDKDAISKVLGEKGLGINDEIVVLGRGHVNGGWGDDGRIVWQLNQCGYTNVHMVNGGFEALVKAGVGKQNAPSAPQPKSVTVANVDTSSHDITTEELLANFDQYKVIDVRDNEEYDGATLHGEKSGGHIQKAMHIRFTDLFKHDGTLKSETELRKMFESKGLAKSDKIVTYCTAGIRSAYMQLILEMLGYENTYNYAESAYRWSNTASAGTAANWDDPKTDISFGREKISIDADGNRLTAAGAVADTNTLKNPSGLKVTYASTNTEIAAVDNNGKVTVGKQKGEVTITATASNGKKASYTVVTSDRMNDPIDWSSREKSADDCIKEAEAGTLVILDTRPETRKVGDVEAGYAAGHIKGSVWVEATWPVDTKKAEDDLRAKVAELKATGKPIAIVCMQGKGGAKRAISVLKDKGIAESKLFILTDGGLGLIKNHLDKLETTNPVNAQSIPSDEEDDAAVTVQSPAEDAAADNAADADINDSAEDSAEDAESASDDTAAIDEIPEGGYNDGEMPDAEPSAE